jgi:diguanylate cyclase (GGDEF)-like protein
MKVLKFLDRTMIRMSRAQVLAVALLAVVIVGFCDYFAGYEISMSLFYLAPVALAAWYAGRPAGVSIALLSCISWYLADTAAGDHYSHPAIPVWNSLVRLGFFLVSALLLSALRNTLNNERRLARTDALTGLCSRRAFMDRLEHDLALAQRHRSAVTLAYLDLDDFKRVNDTRGHSTGDQVLQNTARVLQRMLRHVDTAARLGGDEFALILPDTDPAGTRQVIANLTQQLQECFTAMGTTVTCSIGVVTFRDAAITVADAVAAADALMYEVKRQGKGAVAYSIRGEARQAVAVADMARAVNRR